MSYTYTNLELPSVTAEVAADDLDRRALEDPAFPFEQLSEIAELESWRKEINRPVYHLHKWWAQRLGSVFRSILIGAVEHNADAVIPAFYSSTRYPDLVVFDPFMGSGTTIGEAVKLGMRAIGRDINHVAYFAVRNALAQHDRGRIIAAFEDIERDVSRRIRHFYRAQLNDGTECDILYYFWVKFVPCPTCAEPVDLFSHYVFARHAYPKRVPDAQILCPHCGEINRGRYDAREMTCRNCCRQFDASNGPVHGSRATCSGCAATFAIAETIRRSGSSPNHRLYAKLVLLPDGTKQYLRANWSDLALYEEATQELAQCSDPYPVVPISPGHNSNQVLNYGYRFWHEMFNARQLLGLSILADRIRKIDDRQLRELFVCLFSGALEFNNMFASYKGEGTGAVRPMFAHHILKPERTPLEANLWGTPKSSGAFSTLFRGRLLRALDYRDQPFEVRPSISNGKQTGGKVYGLSEPISQQIVDDYAAFATRKDSVYLSCGDSALTDLPDASVDLVVTDPPFFDNVHYSELADFFHVWQRHVLLDELLSLSESTRSYAEVQSRDPSLFAAKLGTVFAECHRVLRPEGLLMFTYHHSRSEGWHAILEAIGGAGFIITATHPVKAEMSVAAPKAQAHSPIDIDVILVCRKASEWRLTPARAADNVDTALRVAEDQVHRMNASGRALSRNDVRVIVMAQLVKAQSWPVVTGDAPMAEDQLEDIAAAAIDRLYVCEPVKASNSVPA
jgi:putative DNA methylase